MNATWNPFSIATSAASSATIVLPAPTSPCSSRFIGSGRCMSVTISRSATFCPSVSLNGSTRRADSRMRSSTTTARGLRSVACRRLRSTRPAWKRKNSSKISRCCAGVRYAFSASMSVPFGGKCDSTDGLTPIGQPAPLANRRRNRIRHVGRQHADEPVHERPLHARRHRPGFFVDRHDAPGVHRRVLVVRFAANDFVLRVGELQARPRDTRPGRTGRPAVADGTRRAGRTGSERPRARGPSASLHDELEQAETGPPRRPQS